MVRLAFIALAVVLGVLGALVISRATWARRRWPGGLDLIRQHPFVSAAVLVGLAVLADLLVWIWESRTAPVASAPRPPAPAVPRSASDLTRLAWGLVKDADIARSGLIAILGTLGDARAVLVLALGGSRAVDTANMQDALGRCTDALLRCIAALESTYRHARTVAAGYGSAVEQGSDGEPWTPTVAWQQASAEVAGIKAWQPKETAPFVYTSHLAVLSRQLDRFVENTALLGTQLMVADSVLQSARQAVAALERAGAVESLTDAGARPPAGGTAAALAETGMLLDEVDLGLATCRDEVAAVTEHAGRYYERIDVSPAQMWRKR